MAELTTLSEYWFVRMTKLALPLRQSMEFLGSLSLESNRIVFVIRQPTSCHFSGQVINVVDIRLGGIGVVAPRQNVLGLGWRKIGRDQAAQFLVFFLEGVVVVSERFNQKLGADARLFHLFAARRHGKGGVDEGWLV